MHLEWELRVCGTCNMNTASVNAWCVLVISVVSLSACPLILSTCRWTRPSLSCREVSTGMISPVSAACSFSGSHPFRSVHGEICVTDKTLNLLLHLKQLSKPISSDLRTNLLYLLDGVCVCVCVCMHVCVWCTNPIILAFVSGVEYGFLCVYNGMWEM